MNAEPLELSKRKMLAPMNGTAIALSDIVLRSQKGAAAKRRKRSVTQILREAYQRHAARDRETINAVRQVLRQ